MARTPTELIENLSVVNSLAELRRYADEPMSLKLGPYTFRHNPASTATVDNVLCIAATGKGGGRWEIDIPDRQITPNLFGAKGDGVADDSAALQAWLNVKGAWAHRLPPMRYNCSTELVRENGGSLALLGSVYGKSVINFTGDTQGLRIINTTFQQAGGLIIENIGLFSGGVKTTGKKALYVESINDYRPGPIIRACEFKSLVANQEWTDAVHLHDCSSVTSADNDIQSFTRTKMTAFRVTNTVNRPSVEMSFFNNNIRDVKLGYSFIGNGSPGIEGIQITGGGIVGCESGIYAYTPSSSPYIGITNLHINSFGGRTIHLEGYQQINFKGSLLYANASKPFDVNNPNDSTRIVPSSGVYIKDTILCTGDFQIVTYDDIPDAVVFAGNGGGVNMKIAGTVTAATTNMVRVETGMSGAIFDIGRIWNGNQNWGSTNGRVLVDPGGMCKKIQTAAWQELADIPNGSLLAFSTTDYTDHRIDKTTLGARRSMATTANVTIDGRVHNVVRCYNQTADITVLLDFTTFAADDVLIIKRSDELSAGVISIKTTGQVLHTIQNDTGAFVEVFSLPTAAGKRQVKLLWNGDKFEFLGY